ncbi:uncharacterized protein PGTG_21608 [Puccinia graminis f. sp. tritici CRL 75-36-700-3]|uniref:Uncharacterized protein n=1 Tax=Puccinia graminis f. sp. tritici (strain CRL 75-36-700-3 / race SCCL) TaxID=418459 RepID=H6QS34_PUCGT|nr:uncharacterized protein PGTG_21608 [Puccinia graminis f. sp. tritici CRL 75-36-700-3]EHS63480.1 hypothetical protein PGTG_21608 [Puccinia graminis f. sp. tritici CRL 75-36-700-3]
MVHVTSWPVLAREVNEGQPLPVFWAAYGLPSDSRPPPVGTAADFSNLSFAAIAAAGNSSRTSSLTSWGTYAVSPVGVARQNNDPLSRT